MPKVKADQFINSTRTITVPLVFEDENGARQTEPFKVVYRSFSPKVAREMTELENGEKVVPFAKALAAILVSIPDIIGPDEKPIAITEETLEAMEQANLAAIYKAITADVNPTRVATDQADSAALPVTSPAAANKA